MLVCFCSFLFRKEKSFYKPRKNIELRKNLHMHITEVIQLVQSKYLLKHQFEERCHDRDFAPHLLQTKGIVSYPNVLLQVIGRNTGRENLSGIKHFTTWCIWTKATCFRKKIKLIYKPKASSTHESRKRVLVTCEPQWKFHPSAVTAASVPPSQRCKAEHMCWELSA